MTIIIIIMAIVLTALALAHNGRALRAALRVHDVPDPDDEHL